MKLQSEYFEARQTMLQSGKMDENFIEHHLEPGPEPGTTVKVFHECPTCGGRLRYGFDRYGKIQAGRCEFCYPEKCPACGTGPMERGQGEDHKGHAVSTSFCSRCRETYTYELAKMPITAKEF